MAFALCDRDDDDKCMRWVCISAGLTTSARCNQCVTKRRSQSAENFPIAILMERGAHESINMSAHRKVIRFLPVGCMHED